MRGVALKYFGANHHQDEGQRPEIKVEFHQDEGHRPEIIVEQIVVNLK